MGKIFFFIMFSVISIFLEANSEDLQNPRIVVVGEGCDGRSAVISDYKIAPSFTLFDDQLRNYQLWFTKSFSTGAISDRDIQKAFSYNLTPGEAFFELSVLPPETTVKNFLREAKVDFNSERLKGFHNTTTLDFVAVIEGEVQLHTETGSVLLKSGDTAILKAAVHGWSNPGKVPVKMIVTLLGSHVPANYKQRNFDLGLLPEIIYPPMIIHD